MWNQPGQETTGNVPETVTSGSSGGPTLVEPANKNVAQGGTVAVSYGGRFAQSNTGQLYLGISDSSGTLSAMNAAGQTVAGSGTNSISLSADYVDLNAILANLHYTAGGSGTDTINFDIWNQAGMQTTDSISVMIGGSHNAAMTMADFDSAGVASGSSTQPGTTSPSDGYLLPDTATQSIGMPLVLHRDA